MIKLVEGRIFSMHQKGFTLIELIVVMAIVALLTTIAVPRYFQSLDRAKETILVENLRVTRDAIDKFYADRGKYPLDLQELVEFKYLKAIPVDPLTDSSTTWILLPPKVEGGEGIADLRSAAPGNHSNGAAYGSL